VYALVWGCGQCVIAHSQSVHVIHDEIRAQQCTDECADRDHRRLYRVRHVHQVLCLILRLLQMGIHFWKHHIFSAHLIGEDRLEITLTLKRLVVVVFDRLEIQQRINRLRSLRIIIRVHRSTTTRTCLRYEHCTHCGIHTFVVVIRVIFSTHTNTTPL
jgi:hypothetical protein